MHLLVYPNVMDDGLPVSLLPYHAVIEAPIPEELVVQVEAGAEIRGRLESTEGDGIPSADIRVRGSALRFRTKPDGSFHLTDIDPNAEGVEIRFEVSAPWLPVGEVYATPGQMDLLVPVVRGQELEGRVLLPEGAQPLEDRQYWLAAAWDALPRNHDLAARAGTALPGGHRMGLIRADGSFTLSGVPPDHDLRISGRGLAKERGLIPVPGRRYRLSTDFDAVAVPLIRGAQIEGRVTNEAGDLFADSRVILLRIGSDDDELLFAKNGRFTIRGLRAGAYELRAQVGERRSELLTLQLEDGEEQDLELVIR